MRCRTALPALVIGAALVVVSGCQGPPRNREPLGQLPDTSTSAEPLWIPYRVMAGQAHEADPREGRLLELRRVTFDGKSSHPRWHPDSRHLLLERGQPGCGEVVELDLATGESLRLSPDSGGSSLGGYLDEPRRLAFLFAASPSPPCRPSFAAGAPSWAPPDADVWIKGPHAEPARVLLPSPAPEMELSAGAHGLLVFTSLRDGDPELYLTRADGTDTRRLTTAEGYDGGASLSPDGTRVVWQAERRKATPAPGEARPTNKDRGSSPLAEPSATTPSETLAPESLHLFVAGVEGAHPRALAPLGRYDVEPSFLPDNRHLLFSSDYDAVPDGPPTFEIYLMDPDGAPTVGGAPPVERVTYHPAYDGQATVSPDGRWIAFTSSRAAHDEGPGPEGKTDVYVARWRGLQ